MALHGVSAADREWVLARLDEAHRAELAAYLDELHALGIPADSSLVTVGGRRGATVDSTFSALQQEPVWLLAMLLRARQWDWQAKLMAGLDVARRDALQQQLEAEAAVPEALARSLARHAQAAMQNAAPVAASARQHGGLLSRLQGWKPWRR
ncbi:hypothetical protein [Andreprevotia lacus]|uniref:hypothetical protein n=1 Tax=Andreprevotia lacus TaxID=1121000 RepID=UPI00111C7A0F|nr:hypothetical protein [Andreprevotia lacus]